MKFHPLYFSLLIPFMGSACQKPLTSYLQLLPIDIIRVQVNHILADKPLWHDDQESTRIAQAITISTAFQIYGINICPHIIGRMRSELVQAKKKLLEPFEAKDMNWFMALLDGKMPAPDPTPKKSVFSDENPKLFQQLLPLKAVLDYCSIDQEWLKEFIMSKKCGGALRKHIFINAMQYHQEYLVNYLWNGKYRTKVMKGTTHNRAFLRMSQNMAHRSGYQGIEQELKKLYDKLTEIRKAAQVYYPG